MRQSLKSWLVAAGVLLLGRRRDEKDENARVVAPGPRNPGRELAAVLLFAAAGLCATAFPVIYALDRLPRPTQLLGLSLGLAFAFLAAALIVLAKGVVPEEELEEEYLLPRVHDQEEVAEILEQSTDRITRRRLLGLAAGAAGAAVGVALVTPAVSLGPVFDMSQYYDTPWERGRRLVDEKGKPLLADDIETDVFYTAFAEGADKDAVGSSLIVIRLEPAQLELPAGREGWAPEGILAYSKICTHAGCAVNLYRTPLFDPVEPGPALVCPCHYSTFNPATGGTVEFGPAGRPLPQLPLLIASGGELQAGGNFSAAPGPAWWGVRLRKPT
ncbi:MAG TPA: ubiquinol-cytochrome c reductase iron-sulfur subunit [Gaiellaceae bacterium]|nr:ubiquinol-cytochrome c reductase iron-sulfur subunit [Gaiellaceae bacterium]